MRNDLSGGQCATPPRIRITDAIHGWAALVLAVREHTCVSMGDLLRHDGRSSRALADARRLLIWSFVEVSDAKDEDAAIAWLEQCMKLGHRSIVDCLKEPVPEKLRDVMRTYQRLVVALGPADVADTIAAGLLGQRKPRSRVWPKGFLERLGLRNN